MQAASCTVISSDRVVCVVRKSMSYKSCMRRAWSWVFVSDAQQGRQIGKEEAIT